MGSLSDDNEPVFELVEDVTKTHDDDQDADNSKVRVGREEYDEPKE